MPEHYDEPPGGGELFDKPRAKALSKDGGEAISLELVENLKYGGMHIRKWENLAGLGAGTHKLYTHPADQVAGGVVVSLELLQRVCREDGASNDIAMEELRDLVGQAGGE